MFLDDDTQLGCVLARCRISDQHAIASVSVEVTYRVNAAGGLDPVATVRQPTDPPDIRRLALWRGVSLTAAGHVLGSTRGPHLRVLRLSAGPRRHRLVVFGARWWRRTITGQLQASEPEPFEAIAVGWERAYGGVVQLGAGLLAGTDLPHPGGRVSHPLNPLGVGWHGGHPAPADSPPA